MPSILKRKGRTVSYLLATDYAILLGSFLLAVSLRRYDPDRDWIDLSSFYVVPEIAFMTAYALAAIVLFGALGLYLRKTWLTTFLHGTQILKGAGLVIGIYVLLGGVAKELHLVPSRYVLLLWSVFLLTGLLVHRLYVLPRLIRLASRQGLQRRVVLIGDSETGRDFVRRWRLESATAPVDLVGQLCDRDPARLVTGLPRLGRIADLSEIVTPHRIEGAVITNPDLPHEDLMRLIEECVRLFGWVDVHSDMSAIWHAGSRADMFFDIPFARLGGVPRNPFYLAYKRAFDVLAAGLALLVLTPFLAVVLAAVKLTSPGPMFYVRPRIGRNGRPFPFFKIRSMRAEADLDPIRREAILSHMASPDDIATKVVNPEWVTPVGAFIRKWAIDELPQLWNVLRGDMSLVGPRPLPPEEYRAQANWHKRRFEIQPGCTGLWKIYAVRAGISFTDTVLYDLYYARNMNPLLDLSIILQTVWVILIGRADG